MTAHGGDPIGEMSPRRFAALVWWFYTKDREQTDIQKFRLRVWQPPKGVVPTGKNNPFSRENELAAADSLAMRLTGKPVPAAPGLAEGVAAK